MNNQILEILARLEDLRHSVNNGEVNGDNEHIIRLCEAIVADGTFETRSEWMDKLKEVKA